MSGKYRVLVTDKVSGPALKALREDARFEVVQIDDSKTPEFTEALATAHGLIVRSATKVKADMLEKAPELRVVGRAGVGVDNIDLVAATERGVAVLNAPAGNTVSAAELTLALILAMVRRVAEADASMRRGEWARSKFNGIELRGRTLGLVGAGRIGGEVAKRCRAFGMEVLAYDPYMTDERAQELQVERTELDEVIARADILSLHVPLTDATRGMIDADALARMKKGAFLVNVARGGVVDEAALADALASGHLGGAALDVYSSEPLDPESPLRKAPNLLLTPHLGASTTEAQELVASEIAETVRAALADGDLSNALNAPAVGGETLRALAPLLGLGKALGRLATALAPGGIRALDVRYSGSSDEALKPVTAYVLMGLLEQVLGKDQVNFVSAGHLAEQRGIRVARTQLSKNADYTEYLELGITAEQGTLVVAGALLGDHHPRIVRIEDYRVDIVPEGVLIVLKNQDVPGVIGRVGTLLGSHGINIGEYHQARLSKGGPALAAVGVDGDVGETVRSALLGLPEVTSAVVVRLG
ncbi:MAG TPA: phosphoglycerate dehydrogenase [Longimicrobiales bacterium]|nr:phosphoglycerate dehydrogenase [Longimicrobiales bacterium]